MQNYQKLHYSDYQAMLPNGDSYPVSRRECFAPGERPTPVNPFPQRWYYDPESGLAIRLPRNAMGDELGKRNEADLKADEGYLIHKTQCVGKTEGRCRMDCNRCPLFDNCESQHQATNGKCCNKKCESCPHFISPNSLLRRHQNFI